ncbi:MAG TPA: AI-2E family transporter, partial [Stellaceae bacterium]|nr:AI-2E family transporter [Stellaceae bacterium]
MTQSGAKRSRIGGWPLAAAIAAILVFLFYIRYILTPFVLAAALAFILTPAVDWAQRRFRGPRWIYATAAYLLVLVIVILPVVLFGGSLVHDLSKVAAQAPQMLHRYVAELARMAPPSMAGTIDPNKITDGFFAQAQTFLKSGAALTVAGYGIGAFFGIILSLVVLAYFLISGKRVAAGVFWLVPPEYRREVDVVAAKILPLLWRYFSGLLMIVCYTSFLAWIAFGPVFHVPHAPLVALTVGVLELIPLIGPAITFVIVGLISAHGASLAGTIGLFAFAVALRLSLDELVAP